MNRTNGKPYDAEVEYLEVNPEEGARPYINPEIMIEGRDNDFNLSFMPLIFDTVTYAFYAGNVKDNYNQYSVRLQKAISRIYNGGCYATSGYAGVSLESGVKYEMQIKHDGSYIVNNKEGAFGIDSILDSSHPLLIMSGTNETQFAGRFYYFKWVKAGEPVLDLIPVRVGDEGFMYDRVSGKLFGNAGTGKFILGPDIIL